MQWHMNQASHALVVERERGRHQQRSSSNKWRIPARFTRCSRLSLLVFAWGLLWLLSLVIYGTKAWLKYHHQPQQHDHSALLQEDSKLLSRLRIPATAQASLSPTDQPCSISPQAQPGYLPSPACQSDNSCAHFSTLHMASQACLQAGPACVGVTLVPWEENGRFELRLGPPAHTVVYETFDGQQSYVKICPQQEDRLV